jgi:GNAT superfamily N-acetyltransferase
MSDSRWTIRPYRSGDEIALVDLFVRVFKRPITSAHWLWKLRGYERPFENVWLAVDGERIVAQYAGIPVRVQSASGLRWAVLSVDTMVDPDYRRRGLLTQTATHAYKYWQEAGAAFVYGLPNELAGPGLYPLGFKYAFPVRWRRRAVRPFAILAARSGMRFPTEPLDALWYASTSKRREKKAIQLVEARNPDAGFDEIFRSCAQSAKLTFARDRNWIRWRYFLAPEAGYRVLLAIQEDEALGYVAYRLQNAGGLIAEVFAPDDHVCLALAGGAVEQLRTLGARSISTLAIPQTPYDRVCGKLHFSAFKSFGFAVLPLAADLSREHVGDPNAWHLSGGDLDVV